MSRLVQSPVRLNNYKNYNNNKNNNCRQIPNQQKRQASKPGTPIRNQVFTPPAKKTAPIPSKQPSSSAVTLKTRAPSPSPKEYFPKHITSSDSATLTPKTYTSDESFEDPFSPDATLITIDCSVDDRKSTSTKIGYEVNLQTTFDSHNENEIYELLSEQFSSKINIKATNQNQDRLALKKLDRNEQVIQRQSVKQRTQSKASPVVVLQQQAGYSVELMLQLENRLNLTTASDVMVSNMFECFGESPVNSKTSEWREGHIKSAFNYVLIDPRISGNLPLRAKAGMEASEVLRAFVDSIFYIGKGSRARPYAHLHDTVRVWRGDENGAAGGVSTKTEKIPKKVRN